MASSRFSALAARGTATIAARSAGRFAPMISNAALRSASTASATASASASATASANMRRLAFVAGAGAVVAVAATSSATFAAKVDYAAVREAIADMLEKEDYDDGSMGPVLIRLAWHASGTYNQFNKKGGSNGATMRFHAECDHGANAGLAVARDALEPIKARFPGISYADLWTLAGVVAVEEAGGPTIAWSPGRTDAADGSSCPPDGLLPDAARAEDHIRAVFYRMGFSDRETVALIGAHAFGRCHTDRSGFDGPWTRAPTTFSNEFFRLLVEEKWHVRQWNGPKQYENEAKDLMMLPTDMALIQDKDFAAIVQEYAKDEEAFSKDFAAAFAKLLALGTPKKKRFFGLF